MSMLARMAAAGTLAPKLYVDDVFSAYAYSGTGGAQSIHNGINLAEKGGLVIIKSLLTRLWSWDDTVRGGGKSIDSTSANGQTSPDTGLTSYNTSGFSFSGGWATVNNNGESYISWTFRRAPRFFDVITWNGNGSTQAIPHSLGSTPGMVIIKCTSAVSDWAVWHRASFPNAQSTLRLNTRSVADNAYAAYIFGNNSSTVDPSDMAITVGHHASAPVKVNANGASYVAYIFGHDVGNDGMVQCGTYVGNGTAPGPFVHLGWEPQFVLIKAASLDSDWIIMDAARGMADLDAGLPTAILRTNQSSAETKEQRVAPISTGFKITNTGVNENSNGQTYIFMAIRRPNKPPTTGRHVYTALTRTGNGNASRIGGTGVAPDVVLSANRYHPALGIGFFDRLRGPAQKLDSASSLAENQDSPAPNCAIVSFNQDGISLGQDSKHGYFNINGYLYSSYFFRRAPGFMDVVCVDGSGLNDTIYSHQLKAKPELIIAKRRDADTGWPVYHASLGRSTLVRLDSSAASVAVINYFGGSDPTATTFRFPNGFNVAGGKYVAWMFGTLAGISKVGRYTGNGGSQMIDCGFSAGARFLMIKRTDEIGDWYLWDTERGITAGTDPRISFNSTAEEVDLDDSVDPHSSGFVVNQLSATNINALAASYIYFAIA